MRIELTFSLIACAAVLSAGTALAADATETPGKIAFNTYCRTCHSWIKGDNRLGPSLHGVIGRKAGTAPGYPNYSQGRTASGIVWTPEMIDKWITDPYKILPETNMRPFPGIANPAERKKIIDFLEQNSPKS